MKRGAPVVKSRRRRIPGGYASGVSTAKTAARVAQDSTALRVVARIGYVVLGVVHIVIGIIAVSITAGGGGEADQGGAMEQIRSTPAGAALLWAIAAGLVGLAAWQIAEAIEESDPDAKKKWAHRIKFAGTAAAYLAIAVTAGVSALGGSSDSSESSQTFSAQLMSTPGGVILVGLVGVIVFAIGAAFVVRGATRAFEKHLELPSGAARKGIVAFQRKQAEAVRIAPASVGGIDDEAAPTMLQRLRPLVHEGIADAAFPGAIPAGAARACRRIRPAGAGRNGAVSGCQDSRSAPSCPRNAGRRRHG